MNLFSDYLARSPEEQAAVLLETGSLRVERIVSTGQISPPGFWYDQEEDEWVTVLQGSAQLETEDGPIVLQRGDSCFLPAHFRHRVSFTSTEPACIWLCVFSKGGRP